MKILNKILWGLVYALPAVLFFSYHPVISFGGNESMNFELSLPLLWLAIFDILAFVWMLWWGIEQRRLGKTHFEGISDRRFFLLAVFPLYLTFTIFWSANRLRGLLTIAVIWAVFFAVFAILFLLPLGGKPRKLRTRVLLVFFIAAVLVCKFCYVQSIMDILGVDREQTLLCLGCTYRSFGFPHPSGFAIEPQFMGNLLLAPTLTALYLIVFRERKAYKNLTKEVDNMEKAAEKRFLNEKVKLPHINWQKWQAIGMTILAGFLSMTLFFTFSRGAIYAYAVALLILLIFAIRRKTFRWRIITIPVVSFVLALGLQGVFAAVGPTTETFSSAITKSIHQLSLGIIDLRPQNNHQDAEIVDNSVETVENSDLGCGEVVENPELNVEKNDQDVENDAIFEGYVPESTNIRLSLNKTAIKTWLAAPGHQLDSIGYGCENADFFGDGCERYVSFSASSVLFGVGIGGAGTAMHEAYPEDVTSPKEIVQHEGFSLLLESGLVGIALMIFGLLVAFFPRIFPSKFIDGRNATVKPDNVFWQHPALPLLASLIAAYLITLNFFSGLPNALQIYLMPPLLYLIFQTSTKAHGPDSKKQTIAGK